MVDVLDGDKTLLKTSRGQNNDIVININYFTDKDIIAPFPVHFVKSGMEQI